MRAIIHIDLDAFYAQVEHVRLQIPQQVPLCVGQWNGLIAVNYAARDKGIKRFMTVQEALVKCPELKVVHTATYAHGETEPKYHTTGISYQTHKISLEYYRKASQRIMTILQRHCTKFQKASVDEAYLDVTDIVRQKMKSEYGDIAADSIPILSWEHSDTHLIGTNDSHTNGWGDVQLRIAADLCTQMRLEIFNELGYTCSAGISHNKTLAKLVSSMNKPNKQTVIRESQVLEFMKNLDFSKIKGLGGKLGDEIETILNVEKAGELWPVSLASLQSNLGDINGLWVYNISRGICNDPVVQNNQVKTMMACKSFRPAIKNEEQCINWMDILSVELYSRVLDEYETSKRWPKTLVVAFNSMGNTRTKSIAMPSKHEFNSPTVISKKALSLLKQDMGIMYPCHRLSITLTGLERMDDDQTRLNAYFRKPAELKDGIKCIKCFKMIERDQELEHADWHFAMDISNDIKEERVDKKPKKLKFAAENFFMKKSRKK